jgi:drug/metabolite transporter (DMT)-like permease
MLSSIAMPLPAHYIPAAFSLSAMATWGVSDFVGGLGARRVNAFLFTVVVNASGIILMASIAVATGARFPDNAGLLWALAAGSIGGIALAIFYRALAQGKMGLTAPVAAVLGAGLPTIVTALTLGFPQHRQVAGFVLAIAGVWLISRSEDDSERPEGLWLAVLAGVGFAAFYLCVNQARASSALWIAVISRCGSLAVTSAFVVFVGSLATAVPARALRLAILAGCLDTGGSALFVRAAQSGRLDQAVVLSSLYPVITVLLARIFLNEQFSRSRTVGMLAALAAVPMIAW